ncbi:PREDICTED: transmembrane protein 174 [Nanorana parkeri]|uniref:transmembrane protein 174 n=1 Tax=Nanorana parkeri TaxID=125878 RepID=UPI000854FBD8|nr:PREDICTED: transmembrane protein 174 [Nanorana parkeri]
MEQRNSPVDDFSLNVFSVTPFTNNQPDVQASEGDKAGATLLFSGMFLGLVGITFTAMGWIRRDDNHRFEWTQLLGPILLSVGVTFALISVCKFKLLSCKPCKSNEDTVLETDQLSPGQSFVFTGINQPITFHGATVVQYIPPPNSVQDANALTSPMPSPVIGNSGSSIPIVMPPPVLPPEYYSIYTMDNPAFVEENTTLQLSDNGIYRSPCSRGQHEQLQSVNTHRSLPPSYAEIFPELN